MTKFYDVIIIGGGIIGCSSAYQLAKRGVKVALVEKRYIASGPTGKSSAVIRQHYSNELTARMAHHSYGEFYSVVHAEPEWQNPIHPNPIKNTLIIPA